MGRIVLHHAVALDKDVPIPLYYQLKQYILERISKGEWLSGEEVPPEAAFCDTFAISRPTVRQALRELAVEGHLTRAGRHITVAKPKMTGEFFSTLQSFNEEMRSRGLTPSTQVLYLGKRNCPEAAVNLRVEGECICLERLRFADGEPLVWVETYLSPEFTRLLDVDYTTESLYDAVNTHYNIHVKSADRFFEATATGSKEAEILGVDKGSPLCFVKTLTYDQNNNPIEFSIARYRGDKSKFMVRIAR